MKMVSMGGLEPPSPKATDFKSVVYTVSTTSTRLHYLTFITKNIKIWTLHH